MIRSAQRPLAGLVCALPLESRPARRHAQLAVRVCGVSAPALLDAIEELGRGGSRLIVSWGTAGALSPRLRAGELVVPARVVSGDGRALSTDAGCRAGLLRSLRGRPAVHGGALLESRSVLAAPADKQRAGRDHAADAVDMESHRIGDACAALGMPFLVVRAIVDELDDRLPRSVTAAFRAGASPRPGRLLAAAALHPGDWGALARLALRYRRAHAALAAAAEALATYVDAMP